MTFDDFDLDADLLDGIHAMGFTSPSPIQKEAIPAVLNGDDLIACAQTGTGKTAAFVLPVLHKILQLPADGINTLILVPTRELAIQIDQQIDAISYFIDVRSMPIYGGGSGEKWVQQKKALTSGVDMIIATPGRLLAQIKMGGIDFSKLKHFVLDEADRMLDMGFYEDIIQIAKELPVKRQTLCFSATMPPKIRNLTHRILHKPKEISIAIARPAEGIQQIAYSVREEQKLQLVTEILKQKNYQSVILFSSSKEKVKKINARLKQQRIASRAFHSDLDQKERETLMQEFKNKHISVLAGTDILSRGIDVEGIELVINYDVPHDPEDYVHRIGRTARADKTGTAITFINEKDQRRFARIEQLIGREIEKTPLPKGFEPGPAYVPKTVRKNSGKGGNYSNEKKKKFHTQKSQIKKNKSGN